MVGVALLPQAMWERTDARQRTARLGRPQRRDCLGIRRQEPHSNVGATTADCERHEGLKKVGEASPEPEKHEPPVPINKTIRPDYIISLEDGRRYKSLKRHLSSRGLTPEQYRKKWGLRADYPMVAANYAKARSELAKAIGLGQKGKGRKREAKDSA